MNGSLGLFASLIVVQGYFEAPIRLKKSSKGYSLGDKLRLVRFWYEALASIVSIFKLITWIIHKILFRFHQNLKKVKSYR